MEKFYFLKAVFIIDRFSIRIEKLYFFCMRKKRKDSKLQMGSHLKSQLLSRKFVVWSRLFWIKIAQLNNRMRNR